MTELRIGDGNESIVISVSDNLERLQDPAWEGWVDAEVTAKSGVWSGRYAAQFHETDFSTFADGLRALHETLSGTAVFSSLDGYLDLTLTGDGLGHVTVEGEAWDRPGWGSHLKVSFEIDQTYLPPMLTSVESVVRNLQSARQP